MGDKSTKTIETFEKENRDIQAISYMIKFTKSYSTSGSWTNDIEAMNEIQISEGTVINPPVLNGTKVLDNAFYKPTRSAFKFKACQ